MLETSTAMKTLDQIQPSSVAQKSDIKFGAHGSTAEEARDKHAWKQLAL